jgi:hypothetical protein
MAPFPIFSLIGVMLPKGLGKTAPSKQITVDEKVKGFVDAKNAIFRCGSAH